MDVPDSILKLTMCLSSGISDGGETGGHAAKILTPGAAMSGCKHKIQCLG